MIRLIFILIVLMNLEGFCQSGLVVSLSNSPGTVSPGGHFTLFFSVNSDAKLADSLNENITLPEKWKLLSQRKPVQAAGQNSVKYFFVVATPSDCYAGEYKINFTVKSFDTEASVPLTIQVEQIRNIEISPVYQPEFVKEGDTLRVDYLIQNAGNSKETFAIKTSQGSIAGIGDSLTLDVNEKRTVTVSKVIPHTESNAWQSASDLTVKLIGAETPVYSVVNVPVFSSRIRKIDHYFRFPVEVGGGYLSYKIGDRLMTAYLFSAEGKGFLDQKEKHHIDFTIRGPNQFAFPALGNYDQYSLNYNYKKKTFVTVGDYVLQLTNLIEFGRFGRGARLEQQFGRAGFVLFAQKARFFSNQRESVGGKFTYNVGKTAQLGLSYASKNVIFRNNQFWSNLAGISGIINSKDLKLEAELATGNARGKTDYGGFLRLFLTRKWVSVSSSLIYAGKDFYGFYNNSILINNNIGFNITKKLTLGVAGSFSRINPSLDENFYSISPKDRNYMAFASYQVNKRNNFFLFCSTQEREDRQQPSEFHYTETFGNISYNHQSDKFTLFYQGRFGNARNLLVGDNSGRRASYSNLAQPTVRFFPGLWVGGHLEHQHTSKFSANDVIENLFFYGANARINVKRNLYATFLYRNNYAPDELYIKRSFVDASILLDLDRHRFTFTGGRSYVPNMRNTEQNTLFLSLKYALKLNVPLSKKRNMATVRGRLMGSGFSKQGNLIQLGSHKFMTDSTGMFSFEGIAPDQYYLSITQNEARNEGVVPTIRMPLFVNAKADSVSHLEIPFTRTGSVTGKVEFAKATQSGLSSVLSQRPVVLIKLANEQEHFLTEVTDNGSFAFKEMKPGDWKLSAILPGSQDRFLIDESLKDITIGIDENVETVFMVRPNQKRIHFSEKSFDVSVKK